MNMDKIRALIEDLVARSAVLDAEKGRLEARLGGAAERTDLTDEEVAELRTVDARRDEIAAEMEALATERAQAESDLKLAQKAIELHRSGQTAPAQGDLPERFHHQKVIDPYDGDLRSASKGEIRDRALKALERTNLAPDSMKSHAEKLIRNLGPRLQRHVLVTGRDEYGEAWAKAMTGREAEITADEARAMAEVRAQGLTDADGGFAVPFVVDPTIMILDDDGFVNPIRRLARVESITTDTWNGISATSVAAAYGAEFSEVGEQQTTFAQPSVATKKAHIFTPFSVEIEGDFPGLAATVRLLFQEAKDDLENRVLVRGTGTDPEPIGVVTALVASGAPAIVPPATPGTLAAVDIRTIWADLPAKYRDRATWVMDADNLAAIQALGNGGDADFTVNFAANGVQNIIGRPSAEASEMTAAGADVLFGDLRNFLIVDRVGMQTELIPMLMGAAGRPTGTRGIYAWWRNGTGLLSNRGMRVMTL